MPNALLIDLATLFQHALPFVQWFLNNLPAISGGVATAWALSVRRSAKARFDKSVGTEGNKILAEQQQRIQLKNQELKNIEEAKEELLRQMNDRYVLMTRQLESRVKSQGDEIEELNKRVQLIEIENRNLVRENLGMAKYINTLIDKLLALNQPIPERPKEFNV